MMLDFKEAIPLSLYIHLPWCVKKCPYCDFNSHQLENTEQVEDEYVHALIRDIDKELPRVWGRKLISIFIGGGTPSLFSAKSLELLISTIRSRFNIGPEIEITLEANPGTAEAEKFRSYREIGINRLSLGVQSFNDIHLKNLGRIHDSNEAIKAIELANGAGFENFNIDLMFGLSSQSIKEATQDLEFAIKQNPSHISWYQLTIEPNTIFYSKPPVLPDEDYIWEIQSAGQELLATAGYNQYEISAFAKTNQQCVHNSNYWEFGDYLGIGAGAHGKLTDIANGKVERYSRHKIPARYVQLAGTEAVITETRVLKFEDLSLEFMMNAMRLVEGVPSNLFNTRTGLLLNRLENKLTRAEQEGLIDWRKDRLKPSSKGLRYLNDLLGIFVNES